MVMHARKPQKNDGYFEKHQSHSYQSSKYNSKRDYDRGDRSANYRDRDISPGGSLNNGSGSYRSQSPEIDSPTTRGAIINSHDMRDRNDHHRGSDRYSYAQKMRDRDRDIYKKDKYSDKRDRRNDRDSESYRSNHDRLDRRISSTKLCTEKRSGSDDRERLERDRDRGDLRETKRDRGSDRDRDRDRERDRGDRGSDRVRDRANDRGERVARCGDWSEHVSSSGKMYYYNCKTEVSQWEKPKEWIERERNMARDQHREKDHREKDRDRCREERYSRSTYSKHSTSRENSRLRWNYDNDGAPPSHRRRLDSRIAENNDMDISAGDSTPTSEASYPLTGTPSTHGGVVIVSSQGVTQHNDQTTIMAPATIGLPNALPRLASHPNTNSLSSSSVGGNTNIASYPAASSSSGTCIVVGGGSVNARESNASNMLPGAIMGPTLSSTNSTLIATSGVTTAGSQQFQNTSSNHRKLDSVSILQHQQMHANPNNSPNIVTGSSLNQTDHHLNSNAPGPPKLNSNNLVKDSQLLRQSSHGAETHLLPNVGMTPTSIETSHASVASNSNSLRENAINSPLYNLTHTTPHGMSPVTSNSYAKSSSIAPTIAGANSTGSLPTISGNLGSNNAGLLGPSSSSATTNSLPGSSAYTCNSAYSTGLKTVEAGSGGSGINSGINSNTSNITGSCPPSSSSSSLSNLTNTVGSAGGGSANTIISEGPPTPTQELDIGNTSNSAEQATQHQQSRKLDSSAPPSLSSLQSCVASSNMQAGRSQGPEISPKLAKYFRADLITHVTNWPAELLEKQAQKCSEEAHLYGDLQVTRISTELKCARSLVRVTEITATLQEQKIMYLRQQIRRLEESKSQNSFMSDDV